MMRVLTLAALLLVGCGGDVEGPPEPPPPAAIATALRAISPSTINATAGRADSLRVHVSDQFGAGYQGATVSFILPEVPGFRSVTTDATGTAAVAVTWPSRAAEYAAMAISAGIADTARFVVHVRADTAAKLTILTGAEQSGIEGTTLQDQVIVELRDAHNNPVVGQPVSFQPDSGSGTATPTAAGTDANGQAFTVWTLGSPGTNRLNVQHGGLTRVVTATSTARPPVQSDITPPVIQSITFSRDTLRVTETGDTLTIVMRVTDDISGVRSFNWLFLSPSGNQSARMDRTVEGTAHDRLYTIRVITPPFAETGRWRSVFMSVIDASGNSRSYSAGGIASAGFQDSFWVIQ